MATKIEMENINKNIFAFFKFIENIATEQNIDIRPNPKTPNSDNDCMKLIDQDQL